MAEEGYIKTARVESLSMVLKSMFSVFSVAYDMLINRLMYSF